MSIIIDKIVVSKYPPQTKNVLWNKNGILHSYTNGVWKPSILLPVEIEVENSTGEPKAVAEVKNDTLQIYFSGIKGEMGLQGNSGYTGAIDELEVVNNVQDGGATSALSAEMGKSLNNEILDLKSKTDYLESEQLNMLVTLPNIEKVVLDTNTAILEPNKFYDFGETKSLEISFSENDPKYISQYIFQFKSPEDEPTTLIMPEGVLWNTEPTIVENCIYQISVIQNLAIISRWAVK